MAATWLLIFNWIQSIENCPSFSKCNKFPAHPRISILLHILVTAALQYLKKREKCSYKKKKKKNNYRSRKKFVISAENNTRMGKMHIEPTLGGQRSLLRLINFTNICHVHPAWRVMNSSFTYSEIIDQNNCIDLHHLYKRRNTHAHWQQNQSCQRWLH